MAHIASPRNHWSITSTTGIEKSMSICAHTHKLKTKTMEKEHTTCEICTFHQHCSKSESLRKSSCVKEGMRHFLKQLI